MNYEKEFELAKEIALNVGKFLSEQVVKNVFLEEGKDIKLELDRESENLIIFEITKNYDYPILSEEIGLTKAIEKNKPYWIIDPIDGTLNFSRDNPSSCISIALWENNEPIFGVIYDFNRKELFSGYVGVGAWLNDVVLQLQSKKTKSQAILATGFPTYMSDDETTIRNFISLVQDYKKIRMIGSAALSLAYVATGRFDSYIENSIKLWDIAAGVAINKALKNDCKIEYFNDFLVQIEVGII